MSWIIASLLNDREQIKQTADIDSDQYNDVLIIEKAIKTLTEKGIISEEDKIILGIDEDDRSLFLSKSRNERQTYYKKYAEICNRIAYYLGGYYTDEGYLDYIATNNNLTEEQVNSLRDYIKSKFKFQIMRKPINERQKHNDI